MSDQREHSGPTESSIEPAAAGSAELPAAPGDDGRKPYEAPRIVKKRSVANATLFTAMGTTMVGITMTG